ncbi:hypothetical protein [Allomesorhizobium camelthorni]|uniref:hypothetical protein n=1 Tax=Allomesorhizobium camelthorni TaxID=475069 RepID=UPI001981612C|nr:hypothetical protein [Mesorhizobium camelthorni]
MRWPLSGSKNTTLSRLNTSGSRTVPGRSRRADADRRKAGSAKQTSGLFNLVRPQVDTIYEDIAQAGLQMGQLLLARIANHPARELQLVHEPKLQFIEN